MRRREFLAPAPAHTVGPVGGPCWPLATLLMLASVFTALLVSSPPQSVSSVGALPARAGAGVAAMRAGWERLLLDPGREEVGQREAGTTPTSAATGTPRPPMTMQSTMREDARRRNERTMRSVHVLGVRAAVSTRLRCPDCEPARLCLTGRRLLRSPDQEGLPSDVEAVPSGQEQGR